MSSGNKEEVHEQFNTVTKVTSFVNDELVEQLCYYSGTEIIATELYDKEGVLLRQSGIVPNGQVKEYYGDGSVKRIIDFKNGKAHGKGTDYYPSGEIFEESCFHQGWLHGPSKLYRRDGSMWTEAVYRDGRLHGFFQELPR